MPTVIPDVAICTLYQLSCSTRSHNVEGKLIDLAYPICYCFENLRTKTSDTVNVTGVSPAKKKPIIKCEPYVISKIFKQNLALVGRLVILV